MKRIIKNVIMVILLVGVGFLYTQNGYSIEIKSNKPIFGDENFEKALREQKVYMLNKNTEKRIEKVKLEEIRKEEERKAEEERIAEEERERNIVVETSAPAEETYAEEVSYVEPSYTPVYTPNTIGINGNFYSFVQVGYSHDTVAIQKYLDGGNVVASTTPFIANDNQSTYFSGHNPGIFSYMASAIYEGAIITVVDGEGNPHNYKMTDYAYVDVNGESVLQTIGQTVKQVYNNGSGEESILIQYCLGSTMITWYGIPC